jgi:hypothetical protein
MVVLSKAPLAAGARSPQSKREERDGRGSQFGIFMAGLRD